MAHNQIKEHWREQQLFVGRVVICAIVALVLTGVVLTRLSVLQLVKADYYAAQSQGNRIRAQPLPPNRGLIYDRNGKILAENIPSYQLELTPEEIPDLDDTLNRLANENLLDAETPELAAEQIRAKRRFDSIPVLQRMTDEEVAHFAVLRPFFPGVEIRARLTRRYPYGVYGSHALGYVGGISAKDQESIDPAAYAGSTLIGKAALERSYEEELHGSVGHQNVQVNVHGRMMQVLDSQLSTPGKDLILSIDIDTQIAAETALDGKRGAVVAIDPRNGEILVFASVPGFDPNLFIKGLSNKEYQALQNNPDQPLFNRALQGRYPPGSTIKPIVALAGLEKNLVSPTDRRYCPGAYSLPGSSHRYRDWKPGGHGSVNMHDAIAQSCDTYFYDLANKIGIDALGSTLKSFGLGDTTGVDIQPESPGLVPSKEWKRTNFADRANQVWFPGETVITGIGQGYLLVTPLQLASATATIAARGIRHTPSLVRGLHDPATGITALRETEVLETVQVSKVENWDAIIGGMVGVITDPRGTARALGVNAPWPIAGKSGTAQVFTVAQNAKYNEAQISERMRDHALFVAFAPIDNPRIAVAVLVENGKSGSGVAGPIARKVIDAHLERAPL
jgi:penicillin-binding protein 2